MRVFVVFDVLALEGRETRAPALIERKNPRRLIPFVLFADVICGRDAIFTASSADGTSRASRRSGTLRRTSLTSRHPRGSRSRIRSMARHASGPSYSNGRLRPRRSRRVSCVDVSPARVPERRSPRNSASPGSRKSTASSLQRRPEPDRGDHHLRQRKRFGLMRWGFVSPTVREPKLAPINARAETLATSPKFRDVFRRSHAVAIECADGRGDVLFMNLALFSTQELDAHAVTLASRDRGDRPSV